MSTRFASAMAWTALLLAAAALAGCGGAFRLYDESKARFATGIKEQYGKAEVLGAIEVEQKNLDNLLAEELKTIRDHQQLRVDSALLRIADDGTPMGGTYRKKALPRIEVLGFKGIKHLREYSNASIESSEMQRLLLDYAIRITKLAQTPAPTCHPGEALPATLAEVVKLPDSLPADDRASAEDLYGLYQSACARSNRPEDPEGLLKNTWKEWMTAVKTAAALDQSLASAQQDLKAKTDAYEKALAAEKVAAGAADALKKDLQEKAADALKALNTAKEALAVAEDRDAATLSKRLNALVTVLSAAAGGTINTADEDLKKAATIAKEIPSLAGDMDALLKQSKVPPVNGLLLEMRHQLLLLEQFKQLRGFAQQRVDILRVQYHALQEEARLWLRFHDAMCSYGDMKPGDDKLPSPERCDSFTVSLAEPPMCTIGGTPITSCRLLKPWNTNMRDQSNDSATRELYKALATYLQALAIQGTEYEQTFRLIDTSHREALVTRESALRQWDNLIAVPISQLDAYYQAGLKPAEIADLIVKALGFTAIAVGVSR